MFGKSLKGRKGMVRSSGKEDFHKKKKKKLIEPFTSVTERFSPKNEKITLSMKF